MDVELNLAKSISLLRTEKAFEVMAKAKELVSRGQSVINLGIGQPDFKTSHHIVEAACKALIDGYHAYAPANGIIELREAISADVELRCGAKTDPNHIVVVPGGRPTMAFAMLMFGEPGSEILYPDPGYSIYSSLIGFSRATPIPYPLDQKCNFAFSADEVLSRLSPRTRLIILINPANPSGSVASKSELDKLVIGLEKYPNVFVLSDEIYGRITYGNVSHTSLISYEELRERLILLDGCSKTYAMTGWRLGWGIWPASLEQYASYLAVNFFGCVNPVVQYAGIAALVGPQDAVDRMITTFDKRRKILVQSLNRLPGMSCHEPSGAFYAFPNIRATGFSSVELQDRWLEEAGVAIIAGNSFGNQGEGYLRFSYASSTENIQEALRRLEKWLHRNVSSKTDKQSSQILTEEASQCL